MSSNQRGRQNGAPGRPPKRARKKEARDARREAIRLAQRRRRRQRLLLLGSSLVLIAGGVLIVGLLQREPEEAAQATQSPGEQETLTATKPEPVACDADLPESAGSTKKIYSEDEDQNLDPDKTTILHLETSCGDIDIELDVEGSPKTANSVAFLARQKFYDGLVFHRIVPDFVIQGGDPKGDGTGGSGYDVVEPPPEDFKYEEGVVAMAKTGNDPVGTSGSQFFIVSGPDAESLPAEYAVLGNVVEGMDVVEKIESFGRPGQQAPTEFAYIERATIVER